MKLTDQLHTALDELRMQMMGAQVLFGFQFHSVFQNRFNELSLFARWVDAAALLFISFALGMLIAVPSQHRIVEQGNATARIHKTATLFAGCALLPMALAVSCDAYLVAHLQFSFPVDIYAAVLTFVTAIAFWYLFELYLATVIKPPQETERNVVVSVKEKIDQMLVEARVILPGAQALLGFQFVATMSETFNRLPNELKITHCFALGAVLLAIILLVTPAAVHRLVFYGRADQRMHRIGSILVTIALLPLSVGMTTDAYVAIYRMVENVAVAVAIAACLFLILIGLWYVLPLVLRYRHAHV